MRTLRFQYRLSSSRWLQKSSHQPKLNPVQSHHWVCFQSSLNRTLKSGSYDTFLVAYEAAKIYCLPLQINSNTRRLFLKLNLNQLWCQIIPIVWSSVSGVFIAPGCVIEFCSKLAWNVNCASNSRAVIGKVVLRAVLLVIKHPVTNCSQNLHDLFEN